MAKLHKALRVLEIVWLAIGLIGLGSFVYSMVSGRRDQAIYFLGFSVIAGLMYIVRKKMRKSAERDEARDNNQAK